MVRLDGTKVLVTGSFEGMSREEAVAALRARGAVVVDHVGFDVEVVFAGEDPGAEIDSAMELGLRVEDGDVLRASLESRDTPRPPADDAPVAIVTDSAGPPASRPRASAAAKPAAKPAAKEAPTSDEDRAFEKGARVRIVGGREGVGELGEIFWWGDSKFGDGMRAGVTADDGTKYWVDEEHLAWPDAEVDEAALEEAKTASAFARGDRVRITGGKGAGSEGMVFWWGESKWGNGMRAGVEVDGGEKFWVDAEHLAALDDASDDDDIPF